MLVDDGIVEFWGVEELLVLASLMLKLWHACADFSWLFLCFFKGSDLPCPHDHSSASLPYLLVSRGGSSN